MMTGMKTYENHREWLESLEPGNNLNKTAKRLGMDSSTLSRYLIRNDDKFDADYIIRISVAFGRNPITELVSTGLVDSQYANESPALPDEKVDLLIDLAKSLKRE